MNPILSNELMSEKLSFEAFRKEVLNDYRFACESREASLLGRKEVLTGKAKFGIFGDGKEVPQVAMAKYFKDGDFYSGYYRDQTFAFATGTATITEFFAQLYSDPNINNDPHSAGRQMNSHFATRNIDKDGEFLALANQKNIAAGMAPTAGQMPRALGLALASSAFRNTESLESFSHLSNKGNEVCFCTIGDASTSEGHFWETLNAATVMQVPLAVFVWDDGYGISVPTKYQTAKGSISEALMGFKKTSNNNNGILIYKVKAWDYAGMCEAFEEGIGKAREQHIPVLFHVEEVTQPQGHSTSGSHERYKTPERLEWERKWDCIKKMKVWMLNNAIANEEELSNVEIEAKIKVRSCRQQAWEDYFGPVKMHVQQTVQHLKELMSVCLDQSETLQLLLKEIESNRSPENRDIMRVLGRAISITPAYLNRTVFNFYQNLLKESQALYNSHFHLEGPKNAMCVTGIPAEYEHDAPNINGYEIINKYFDQKFAEQPTLFAFGEDVGQIGDVNQGFAGLQEKYGKSRIFDTGIRELTIIGQGIGMAMRGLRPIAEIQYLDYLLYGLQPLSDDVSTLQFRTAGSQVAPIIVRTRGHRLEGIWHSGSPMGMIINALRGMYVCVPRNMVQAAGMYNTLIESNEPGLVIESLNGYRLKEKLPSNLTDFRVPFGIPEVLREGTDITIVSYGSTLRIISEAADWLANMDIHCEIIDVQTLLPFDINHKIVASLQKTNRIIFIDEDVPGGAAAYMFSMVMEKQGGYRWLDVSPRTLTAKPHRPGYGSDGDYFSKPNTEDVIAVIMEMMKE
jgi:pyruvate/2-oxoglutarate/acetoin dehydrogenase E1 component/TPP-dependent pyruvate/acetoin dehydrogenase alpha subunit